MAKIADFNTLITDRQTGSANSVAKERELWQFVRDELYSDDVTDSQTSQTYTTKSGTSINYSLFLKKVGNNVYIKVTVINATTGSLSPQMIFTWKDNEYQPKSGAYNQYYEAKILGSGNSPVLLFLNSTGLRLASTLPPSAAAETLSFEFYIAKN